MQNDTCSTCQCLADKSVFASSLKKAKELSMHHIEEYLVNIRHALLVDTCKHASSRGKRHRLHTHVTEMHRVCEEDVHMLAASGLII